MKYHIWTIGCQMNEADSGRVATELDARGFVHRRTRPRGADVIVLNTCVVRQATEDRGRPAVVVEPLKESIPAR